MSEDHIASMDELCRRQRERIAELEVKLEDARRTLDRLARPMDCGCVPCRGSCRDKEALEIVVDEMKSEAHACLDRIKEVPTMNYPPETIGEKLVRLESELDFAKKTLRWYADPDNWKPRERVVSMHEGLITIQDPPLSADKGAMAEWCLGKLSEGL